MRPSKIRFYYFAIPLVMLLLIGCKDNGTGSSNSGNNKEPSLAIQLVNTGKGDFTISGNPDGYYVFCYENDGCDGPRSGSGGTFSSWADEGQKNLFDQSESNKTAIGVDILFYVTEGTGKIEVLNGTSSGENLFDDDYGFEVKKVVDTKGPFSKGDKIQFSYGDVQ